MSTVQVSVDVWSKANEFTLACLYNSRFPKFEDFRWKQLVEHKYIEYARGSRYFNSQGSSLSTSARLRLQQQQHVRSFMHPVLLDQVAETLKDMEVRKEQGTKPERIWFPDRKETGTPSVAEWMGY